MSRELAHSLNALIDSRDPLFTLENVEIALGELATSAALLESGDCEDACRNVLYMAGRIAVAAASAINFERGQWSKEKHRDKSTAAGSIPSEADDKAGATA